LKPGLCSATSREQFNSLDLTGPGSIYGEAVIIQDGYFLEARFDWGFKAGHYISGKYSFTKLNMLKLADIGDTLSVDDLYPLTRHQAYISSNLSIGSGFRINPAAHFLFERYEAVAPRHGADSAHWIFPVEKFSNHPLIGYLAVTKDFQYIKAAIFTALSNLNESRQFQAGFQVDAYLPGNAGLILSSKLLNHRDDGNDNLVFDQVIRFNLSKQVVARVNATFGKMSNYYENHAADVYDLFTRLTFKGAAKLEYSPGPHFIISAEYQYLACEGFYMFHENAVSGNNNDLTTMKDYRDYLSQAYLFGIKWSF
jgi:hypothetical protein